MSECGGGGWDERLNEKLAGINESRIVIGEE